MKLYFSRNLNPRVAVAVAKYLEAPVEYAFAAPRDPAQRDYFERINPNGLVPILVEDHQVLWETDAIACRLSRLTDAGFWRTDDAEPDMIRWLSWGTGTFVRPCEAIHFERVTKPRYEIGPTQQDVVEDNLAELAGACRILDEALAGREWLVGDAPSYADFRMASVLPFCDTAGLPVLQEPNIAAWYERLNAIEAWRDPFDGLDAPELPPIPPERVHS